jgi:hypothetical protein
MKILNLLLLTFICLTLQAQKNTKREWYEMRIYQYATAEQGATLDAFLEKALLPALHRRGVRLIGVFQAIANDTALVKKTYLLIPYPSPDVRMKTEEKLLSDKIFLTDGSAYLDAPYDKPPYTRMETILLQAFRLAPEMQLPRLTGPRESRVYELRSYESATEKIYRNKVEMFNEGGEIPLFERLGFNAIFYADVISGPKMPNLMYMTSFADKADRDAHWKTFSADPEWKKLSSMPKYQRNVSKVDITFLRPTAYSDY